jgi:hypothetical protein
VSVLALAASAALACAECAAQSEEPVEEQGAVVTADPAAEPQPGATGEETTGEVEQAFRGGGGRGGVGRGGGGRGGGGWGHGGGGWGGHGWGGHGWHGGWGGGYPCYPGSPYYPACLGY